MEAWSVGKYAKRSCLVHLSSEDASNDLGELKLLNLDIERNAGTGVRASGPLQIVDAVQDGVFAGDELTRLEVVASVDSTEFSFASTGTNMLNLKSSINTPRCYKRLRWSCCDYSSQNTIHQWCVCGCKCGDVQVCFGRCQP